MSWNTPQKPWNINVLDSKFEKSVGELHATLWGTLPDPVAVEKNLRVLMWCPEVRVAWPILDCHAALMLPALALRLALADPFRGLVAAIRIGGHHAVRLCACG